MNAWLNVRESFAHKAHTARSQDVLLFRKKNVTVATWLPGTPFISESRSLGRVQSKVCWTACRSFVTLPPPLPFWIESYSGRYDSKKFCQMQFLPPGKSLVTCTNAADRPEETIAVNLSKADSQKVTFFLQWQICRRRRRRWRRPETRTWNCYWKIYERSYLGDLRVWIVGQSILASVK